MQNKYYKYKLKYLKLLGGSDNNNEICPICHG